MIAALHVVLALAVGLFGPRARGALLTLFALALFAFGALALLTAGSMSIVLFALFAFLGLWLALLLPHLLPRIFIALLGLLELPFLRLASGRELGLLFLIPAALAVLFFAVRKPQPVMRIACAVAGALLLAGLLPEAHALLWLLLAALLLFAIQELLRRLVWHGEDVPGREDLLVRGSLLGDSGRAREAGLAGPLRWGAALGAVAMLLVLLLPLLVPPLPPPIASERPDLPPLPFSQRRQSLAALAPHGGLVWPLPSEAIFWDEPNLDRALFPFFDNLDALYLGVRTAGLAALPGTTPLGRISLHAPLAAARLVHDAPSLARLRAAAGATVAALHDILPLVKPGTRERDLEPALKAAMRAHGCGPESFPLIFASGPSAAAPHGSGNLGVLEPGTLLVADLGCSIDHYASDFTRTLPVSGTFTPRQKLLYENVLAAQSAALAMCKPGASLALYQEGESMEHTARAVLKARAPDGEAHMDHPLGHTVGLFVHDIELPGPLAEDNVLTLEPGTYLPHELGIRIEDTFVVTKNGCDRLTEGFPAEVAAVESAMAGHP